MLLNLSRVIQANGNSDTKVKIFRIPESIWAKF